MPWPATNISNRSAGEFIDDPDWDELVDALNFLANRPACRVYRSTAQSVNDNAGVTVVTFDTERFDTDNMHSTSVNTSRITFTTAGLYQVTFHGAFAAGNDYNVAWALIRLNGATTIAYNSGGRSVSAVSDLHVGVTTLYKFAAADYVEISVGQDNSANTARNLLAATNYSPECSAVWLGRG